MLTDEDKPNVEFYFESNGNAEKRAKVTLSFLTTIPAQTIQNKRKPHTNGVLGCCFFSHCTRLINTETNPLISLEINEIYRRRENRAA